MMQLVKRPHPMSTAGASNAVETCRQWLWAGYDVRLSMRSRGLSNGGGLDTWKQSRLDDTLHIFARSYNDLPQVNISVATGCSSPVISASVADTKADILSINPGLQRTCCSILRKQGSCYSRQSIRIYYQTSDVICTRS